ncbi:hypothetical protein ACFOWM_02340 [Ferruginibacter yonginensis]|uniref:FkbM family methyltransferase n=1 Tax=Ferruginibacter yonginensis TaxID=1310416 RepID=A0ABV8QN27_9BACT
MKKLFIKFFKILGYVIHPIHDKNTASIIKKGKEIIQKIAPQNKVLYGPFKGLQYPSLNILQLSLVPKILGSYEAHLHNLFTKIINHSYKQIIDIGSAEGYYAVGLAVKLPQSIVHCFEMNEEDILFCQQMAQLNGANNVIINNACTVDSLRSFSFQENTLIICDCEGYEYTLFNDAIVISKLSKVDILIELHDHENIDMKHILLNNYKNSHTIEMYNNWNVNYDFVSSMNELTDEEKAFSVQEHRGGLEKNKFMEWVFLKHK